MPVLPSEKPTRQPLVGLKPPQFHLRTMLLAVTACAVLFALAKWWSGPVIVGVLFLLVSVGLHVAGNALGTQLRKNRGRTPGPGLDASGGVVPAREPLPATQLAMRRELGQPIRILTVAGAILGALGGCVWTWFEHGEKSDWWSYLIAGIAFAALGGFWSFLTVGFLQVTIGAALQAIRGSASEPPTPANQDQNVV